MLVQSATAHDRAEQQRQSDQRAFHHSPRTNIAQIEADQNCDGNGREDRGGCPGAVLHRVHHDEPQHRDQDHHDDECSHHGGITANGAELIARHLSETASVATRRHEQHGHVLHASADDAADQNPQRARQEAELCGERGTNQWPGACDGREVMAEHDPTMRGDEIAPVVQPHRGGQATIIGHQHLGAHPCAVEAVAERIDAHGGDDDPHGIDRFASMQGKPADGECAEQCDADPEQLPHSSPGTHDQEAQPTRPPQSVDAMNCESFSAGVLNCNVSRMRA